MEIMWARTTVKAHKASSNVKAHVINGSPNPARPSRSPGRHFRIRSLFRLSSLVFPFDFTCALQVEVQPQTA